MKKIILFVSLFVFLYIPYVNAEVDNTVYQWTANQDNLNLDYTNAYTYISNNNFDNWAIVIPNGINSISNFWVVVSWSNSTSLTYLQDINYSIYGVYSDNMDITIYYSNDNTTDTTNGFNLIGSGYYLLYDSNFNFISQYNYELSGFYDNSNLVLEKDQPLPNAKDLIEYNSWNDYYNNQFTTVNLDDYYYVILSLKNYGRYQAYDVPLKVKGMVGITPIYNFGTSEKDTITDRCNISYSDFTDYRLYILEQDLQNNAVYAVKSCENGSSFKFRNSDFNITYVTDDNANDPVVTIDGVEYHTIPFDNLSVTANSNEEDNFIPGESKEATFSDVVSNITDTLGGLWNTLSAFMTLVTRFFRTLPSEFQTIAITSFTVMCTIGIIKFIRG